MTERLYETWEDPEEHVVTCGTSEQISDMRARGLLSRRAEQLFTFHAATHEEAMSIRNLRMGWEPYQPEGAPAPCPSCEAWFYPEGSGQCWRCGPQG